MEPVTDLSSLRLPPDNISLENFTTWKGKILAHFQQSPEYQMFLPEGLYSEWIPLEDTKNGQRIPSLHPNDPDRLRLEQKLRENDCPTSEMLGVDIEWLNGRNSQLNDFINILSSLSTKASHKIIKNYGTSFDLIMNFILDSHNYEKKHKNILELCDINFSLNQDHTTFYSQFRDSVSLNLKKVGTKIKFMNDFILHEDEILSPTFEEVILLWCLERIDPRLPAIISQAFGHKLVDGMTLKDIQDEIFDRIPQFLEETSKDATNNAVPDELRSNGPPRMKMKSEPNLTSNKKSSKPRTSPTAHDIHDLDEAGLDVKQEIADIEQDLAEHIEDISKILNDFDTKVLKDAGDVEKMFVGESDNEDNVDLPEEDEKDWEPSAALLNGALTDEHEQRHCEFCNGFYKSKKILLEHVRGIHKVKYTCKICNVTLNNHKSYEKHLKELHSAQFPSSFEDETKLHKYVCRYCHEPQSDIEALREHIAVHKNNGEISYLGGKYKKNPKELRKTFMPKARALRKRVETKKENKDFLENEENGGFEDDLDPDFSVSKKELNEEEEDRDIDSGGGGKQHRCDECGRTFGSLLWLISHLDEHRKGPIQCEFCDRKLKNKRVLSEHIRIRHRLTFRCKGCNKILKNQRVYEEHIKNNHKDLYSGQHGLKVRSNSHVCRYCLEPQKSHQELKVHTFEHKERGELNFIVKSPLDDYTYDANQGDIHEIGDRNNTTADFGDIDTVDDKPIPISPRVPRTVKTKEKKMCDICGKSFTSVEQHKKIHSIENLHCDICDINFQDRKSFLKHKRKHRSNEKNASCDLCGKSFTRITHLKVHLKKHAKVQRIGGEKLKCETCKRSFFDKKEMGSHVCKHHACEMCGEKFLRARNLKLHKRMHLGEVVYPCDSCESLFLTKKRRREHFRDYHRNEKKHKCDICDKRFLMKSGLAHHMFTHTGEKPFKCSECGIGFTQKGNLDIHMKLHTDEMPYECSVCHAKFKQSGEIKRHREVYKCGFTQDDFYTVKDQQT